MQEYTKAFTHGGVFHADDVFTAAFIQSLWPGIKIQRGFSVPENFNGLVFDIGMGRFDHHQKDNEIRENGVPYASLGKVWREFAPQKYSDHVVKKIDEQFIQPLDLADNTGAPNALSHVISGMNPNWDSSVSPDQAFAEAVQMASSILTREIENELSRERAVETVKSSIEHSPTKDVIILDKFVPWQDYVRENVPEAKFIVFPSDRGGYNIQTIPSLEDPKAGRVPFPERWLGNPDKSLGMTFCHVGNFLASCETLEQAVNVAQAAIQVFEKEAKDRMGISDVLDVPISEFFGKEVPGSDGFR